jgi:hypothetical protein
VLSGSSTCFLFGGHDDCRRPWRDKCQREGSCEAIVGRLHGWERWWGRRVGCRC